MNMKGIITLSLRAALVSTLAVIVASGQSAWAQKKEAPQQKVYRWVDEDGNVHYSESLPPDYEQETHDELDEQGVVREGVSRKPPPPAPKPIAENLKGELPRDKSGMQRPEPLYTDAEKQERMDRLLLLRYHSEQEILDAMDVEIKQLEYDKRLLASTRESLQTSLIANITVAGDRQRAGMEVKEETLNAIKRIRGQIASNQKSLQGLQTREANIREEFGKDVERYRELVEKYSEEES